MKNKPIGVFDSGVGGLTVVRSMIDALPDESIIYLGDDARGPYGPRDLDEVRGFAHEIIDYLMGFPVKLIVVACNTATAAALEEAHREYDIPIVGVLMPGVRAALEYSRNRRIGVIGTTGTISTGRYEMALKELDPEVLVFSRACPEFVEYVERGDVDGERIFDIAEGYLEPMLGYGVDSIILGCTHYPLLEGLIKRVVGPEVKLISSADVTAEEVGYVLDHLGWLNDSGSRGTHHFLTTGDVEKCVELGRMFLGPEVSRAIPVTLDERPSLDI